MEKIKKIDDEELNEVAGGLLPGMIRDSGLYRGALQTEDSAIKRLTQEVVAQVSDQDAARLTNFVPGK